MDGVSLLPYITGGEGLKTDTVFGEYMAEGSQTPVIMIRRGKWKFIYSLIDPPMLFDVEADPLEATNLIAGLPIPVQQKTKGTVSKGETGLPTPPNGEAPGAVTFVSTEKSFFPRIPAQVVPTPPRTPSPTLPLVLPEDNDPKTVFADLPEAQVPPEIKIFNPQKRKRQRDGYEEGDTLIGKSVSASDFVSSKDPLSILSEVSQITFPKSEEIDLRIRKFAITTKEIAAC